MDLRPILLSMDIHCRSCANLICTSLTTAFGAHRVAASRELGMVQIYGGSHLDPWAIKYFLQRLVKTRHGGRTSMWRRRVSVVDAGGRKDRSHVEGIVYLGPKPSYGYDPYYPPPPPPPPPYYGARPRWF